MHPRVSFVKVMCDTSDACDIIFLPKRVIIETKVMYKYFIT